MTEKAVTIGDTEVEIRETDDGFEAVEADDEPEGLYVRATSSSGSYGFEIPLDEAGAFDIERSSRHTNPYDAAWDPSANVDDSLRQRGNSSAEKDGFDGYAVLQQPEIVER